MDILGYFIDSREMSWRGVFKAVGAFAFAGILSGCAVFSLKPEAPLKEEVTQWVLDSLRDREARIQSIKGLFEASVTGSVLPISQNLNGVLFYQRPYSVRLRGFGRVGGTVFEFQRNGDHYQLRIPPTGEAVQGRITALDGSQDVNRVVELSLKTMDAILGKIEKGDENQVMLYLEGERFRMDIQNVMKGEGPIRDFSSTRLWITRDTFDVVQVEYVMEDDEIGMVVECSDFRVVKSEDSSTTTSIRLPFHIRAEDYRSMGGSLTLSFIELAANAASAAS